jgi:uncharacterized metal-binding protein YceD (DUF177 family)
VDYLEQFVIPLHGLKNGQHHYTFNIGNEFFESFEYSEISQGQITVNVNLDKQERLFVFEIDMEGMVNVMCDRCSGYFDQIVKGEKRLIVKYGQDHLEETEEILVIPEKEHRFDLSTFIYEYIILLLPYKKVHPEDEGGNSKCDPDMIKRLEEHMGQKTVDTRWDALKNIKFKNE